MKPSKNSGAQWIPFFFSSLFTQVKQQEHKNHSMHIHSLAYLLILYLQPPCQLINFIVIIITIFFERGTNHLVCFSWLRQLNQVGVFQPVSTYSLAPFFQDVSNSSKKEKNKCEKNGAKACNSPLLQEKH